MARRLLVAALAVAMTVVTLMSSAAADTLSWRHVPVPAQVRPQAGLNEAVALGPDRAWAVGADAVGREAPGFPLVLRWDGTAWQRRESARDRLAGRAAVRRRDLTDHGLGGRPRLGGRRPPAPLRRQRLVREPAAARCRADQSRRRWR